jgi:peptide chain release factor subunit 1
MSQLDRGLLRRLAEWPTGGAPVYSLYLDVDGRRSPRRKDYLARAMELCRGIGERATGFVREDVPSGFPLRDTSRFMLFLERDFERGATRGVAMFSCARAGLWEVVTVARPFPDRAAVAEAPYLLPLEALVEIYESFCTVLVDRSRARIFLAELGTIEERSDIFDEVPRRHDQGGWAQARLQRHADTLAGRHLRHVADVLFAFHRQRGFDHLILAGPDEAVHDLERLLHDYLRQRVVARETLAVTASADDVLQRSLAVEERRETERERAVVERLLADAAAGRGAVVGLAATLEALAEGRVRTLVVPLARTVAGVRCSRCGRLDAVRSRCATCGGRVLDVPDVLEAASTQALRTGSTVEALSNGTDAVGALLRY